MPRRQPRVSHGVIPAAASGNILALFDKIIEEVTTYQSNGVQAWELAKDYTSAPGTYEKVLHSVGDRSLGGGSGDTDIWLDIKFTVNDIYYRVAMDFCPQAVSWSAGTFREAGGGNVLNNVSDTAEIEWWCWVDEYEIVFVSLQSGMYYVLHCGQVIRPWPDRLNGVARFSGQSGTGDGVTITLDRDISANIQPGQKVWLLNQTPSAAAAVEATDPNIVTVVSCSDTEMVVDGVADTFSNGSLVGLDPAPVLSQNGYSLSSYYSTANYSGTYLSATSQNNSLNGQEAVYTATDFDPDVYMRYVASDLWAYNTVGTARMVRGYWGLMRRCTKGTQADGDIVEVDLNASDRWMCFVSNYAIESASYVTLYGPGLPA